jgi:hypothetical protein
MPRAVGSVAYLLRAPGAIARTPRAAALGQNRLSRSRVAATKQRTQSSPTSPGRRSRPPPRSKMLGASSSCRGAAPGAALQAQAPPGVAALPGPWRHLRLGPARPARPCGAPAAPHAPRHARSAAAKEVRRCSGCSKTQGALPPRRGPPAAMQSRRGMPPLAPAAGRRAAPRQPAARLASAGHHGRPLAAAAQGKAGRAEAGAAGAGRRRRRRRRQRCGRARQPGVDAGRCLQGSLRARCSRVQHARMQQAAGGAGGSRQGPCAPGAAAAPLRSGAPLSPACLAC